MQNYNLIATSKRCIWVSAYYAIEFSQKYSHEQIYEADLIAYRFLENMGSGEDFINGLRILGSNYDSLYEENRYDRPSTSERIDFLKYVQSNPQIGNKINAHMRQQAAQATASRKRRRWLYGENKDSRSLVSIALDMFFISG